MTKLASPGAVAWPPVCPDKLAIQVFREAADADFSTPALDSDLPDRPPAPQRPVTDVGHRAPSILYPGAQQDKAPGRPTSKVSPAYSPEYRRPHAREARVGAGRMG